MCRDDFLFYAKDDAPAQPIKKLSDLTSFVGNGLIIDMRGRSTLGAYYLMAALDLYSDWKQIYPAKITSMDNDVAKDLKALSTHCDTASCRNKVLHDYTGTHGAEFARRKARPWSGIPKLSMMCLPKAPPSVRGATSVYPTETLQSPNCLWTKTAPNRWRGLILSL